MAKKMSLLSRIHMQGVEAWFDKTRHSVASIAAKVRAMPPKQKAIVGAGIALSAVAGYFTARAYMKKFDGRIHYLQGVVKSEPHAEKWAADLRMRNMTAHVAPMRAVGHTVYRVYARRA